jgi:hypothetical protein
MAKKNGPIYIEKLPSNYDDNYAHSSAQAKYLKHFYNPITGERFSRTDLDEKKDRRLNKLTEFIDHYTPLCFEKKTVTILSCIVSQYKYPNIGYFFECIRRKFKRLDLKLLGKYWQRDVGETQGGRHYHVLIALTRMSKKQLEKIGAEKYKPNTIASTYSNQEYRYKIQYMDNEIGMYNYLKEKQIYHGTGERNFGCSHKFFNP